MQKNERLVCAVFVALLFFCSCGVAKAKDAAALLADIQVHFSEITAADLAKLDQPLADAMAVGKISEILVVMKSASSAQKRRSFLSVQERRQFIIEKSAQNKNKVNTNNSALDTSLRKSHHAIAFKKNYIHIPIRVAVVKSWRDIKLLLDSPLVLSLAANRTFLPVLTQSKAVINQPLAVANTINGAGTTVAIFDTGVDYTRAEFGSCTSPGSPAGCRVVFAQDFAPDDGQLDAVGHGTVVSAIVAEVASAADLVVLDVFDGGSASSSDIIDAVDWVVANAVTYNIVSANFSLSDGTENSGACDTSRGPFANPFKTAFDTLVAVDVLPVAASGNDGHINGISSPACVTPALSVGATYDAAYSSLGWGAPASCTDTNIVVDDIACFSNSGSILDLLAPGALITAAGATSGGTSDAAPHVAAAAAMIKQQFPLISLTTLEQRLETTGTVVVDSRNGLSFPRLDLQYALDLTDSDGDGVLDLYDPAILDPCVPSQFANGCSTDTDADGKTDASEGELADTDTDGLADYLESSLTDTDSDGVADELDPDNNDPCIPSQFVAACGMDSDGDGKTDASEGALTDTDGDGVLDYLDSAITDQDNDGVVDELDVDNTNPCLPSQFASPCTTDTDSDGKTDAIEGEFIDSDGDGVVDYLESDQADSDSDGTVDEADAENNNPCIPDVESEACDIPKVNVPLPLWVYFVLALLVLSTAQWARHMKVKREPQ